MKHLKLYEEYTDSTIDTGGTQSTGKTTPKPGTTVTPRTTTITPGSNVIEVVLYSDEEQKSPEKRGWINLKDWDKAIKNPETVNPYITIEGKIYSNENYAKLSSNGELLDWIVTISTGEGAFGSITGDERYCQSLHLFLRNRYLQKNASNVWIIKVSPGGFSDNSSVDTPDKFA